MQLSYFAQFIWTSLHRSVLDNSSVVESHFHFNSYVHFIVLYHCFFSMKTGLLKWKPDYEGASLEYGKAG